MIVETDYKKFQKIMNDLYPTQQLTEAQAAEAFHNLVGFINILTQINDRLGLVPNSAKNN